MNDIGAKWAMGAPYLRSALRIVAAIMFITSGTVKLHGWPMAMPEGNVAEPFNEIWIAGVLETYGGLLMLLGLFTRPVAFILSGLMAVAYWKYHFPNGFWPMLNGGTDATLYCFIWLYFSAAGAGPLSLDALLSRPSKP